MSCIIVLSTWWYYPKIRYWLQGSRNDFFIWHPSACVQLYTRTSQRRISSECRPQKIRTHSWWYFALFFSFKLKNTSYKFIHTRVTNQRVTNTCKVQSNWSQIHASNTWRIFKPFNNHTKTANIDLQFLTMNFHCTLNFINKPTNLAYKC